MINKEKLLQWEARVNALQMRERLLLLLTLIALTYGVIDLLFLSPLQMRMEQSKQSLLDAQNRLVVIEQQSRDFAKDQDPLAAQKQERDSLQQALAEVQNRLEARMGNLLSQDEAPQLLSELIDKQRNLQLISLSTRQQGFSGSPADNSNAPSGFNRFNLELNMQGSFMDTLRFVQSMEASEWQLFWDTLNLDIVEHPNANVKIQLYTLGTGT